MPTDPAPRSPAGDPERPGAEHWVPARHTLAALRRAAPDCRGCELWRDARHVVFSQGRASAAMMLIGEQPGDHEDTTGEPFVGPAGRLLDEALDAAHIDRESAYLTNAVKHFRHHVSGKRRIHDKPEVGNIVACHPWLEAELEVVHPQVVVCLGATAVRAVLGRSIPITRSRGQRFDGPDAAPDAAVFVTTHPSAVLRLRGKDAFDEAFDRFVADLETAASAVG
ncbi:UdgX family uracil-DNA binding protein, partial [Humibacter sp.]|uniref:UdgX family uracil-DNA binding protein n=1 Tax=Humibacter sp. TaxID=1940291 RepID=UPI003F8168AA